MERQTVPVLIRNHVGPGAWQTAQATVYASDWSEIAASTANTLGLPPYASLPTSTILNLLLYRVSGSVYRNMPSGDLLDVDGAPS